MLEAKLEQDIKSALLSGDSRKATTLRGLKAVLLNVKVASGKRQTGLDDDEVLTVFAKEAKKRQESADLYKQGGNEERYQAELDEKAIIESYLPAQLSDDELIHIIDEVIEAGNASDMSKMGQVIGQVKSRAGAAADGAKIAQLVKERLA